MQYATWNPADKDPNIVLSGGNLIATTNANGWDSVRSNLSVSAGKWYFEVTATLLTDGYAAIGIADSGVPLGAEIGMDPDGYGYRGLSGDKINNSVWTPYGDVFVTGDVISVALDMDVGKIWWAKNGVWQASGDPAAGTNEAYSGISGPFFAALSLYYNTWAVTANFGASAFSHAVPAGFRSGFGIVYEIVVTNPSISADGLTGIDARDVTNPFMSVEGLTGITAEPSISMIRAAATLSDNMIHIESFVTIPSMSAKLTQAKQIWGNVSIPSMIAEATERETTLANVSIPMMTVDLASGIHADLEATAPMATAEGLFSGQAEITIPMMTAELEGKVGRIISSAVKVPMMTVEAAGKTEHLADGAVSIPMMRVATKLMTGKIIAGAAEVPMMTADLTSYEDITGDIDVSIPMIEPYMVGTPERDTCVVLRFTEPDL